MRQISVSVTLADWSESDWNGDGGFDSSDFVAAFSDGGFELGLRPAASVVLKPGCLAFATNRHGFGSTIPTTIIQTCWLFVPLLQTGRIIIRFCRSFFGNFFAADWQLQRSVTAGKVGALRNRTIGSKDTSASRQRINEAKLTHWRNGRNVPGSAAEPYGYASKAGGLRNEMRRSQSPCEKKAGT